MISISAITLSAIHIHRMVETHVVFFVYDHVMYSCIDHKLFYALTGLTSYDHS